MRREFVLVLLAGAAGRRACRARCCGSPGRTPSSPRRGRCPRRTSPSPAKQLVPLASALALAALACLAAVIATRIGGQARRRRPAGRARRGRGGRRDRRRARLGRARRRQGSAAGRTRWAARRPAAAHPGGAGARDRHRGAAAMWSWPARPGARWRSPAPSRSSWRAWPPPGGARAGRSCRRGSSGPAGGRPAGAAAADSATMWESLSRDIDPTESIGPTGSREHQRRRWPPRPRSLLAEHEPEVAEMSARYLRRDGLRVRLVTDAGAGAGRADRRPGRGGRARPHHARPGSQAHPPRAADTGHLPGGAVPGRAAWPRRARGAGSPGRSARASWSPWSATCWPSPAPLGRAAGAVPPRTVRLRLRRPDRGQAAASTAGAAAVIADGRPVPLTTTEFAVLAALLGHRAACFPAGSCSPPRAVRRPGDRAADVYIAQLRAKIGRTVVIRTVRGAGYAIDP